MADPDDNATIPKATLAKISAPGVEVGRIALHCGSPAPLAINGHPFVGCPLPEGHEGNHAVLVEWSGRHVGVKRPT